MNKKALILGIIVGALIMRIFLVASTAEKQTDNLSHTDNVHVHADFLMILDSEKIDLTQDKYQSTVGDVKHPDLHLHDNQGNIIHRHAEGVTFGDFLHSINFSLIEECLTTDTGREYCADEDSILALYVNGDKYTPIDSYVINDADQTLLYYGENDTEKISEHLGSLTDEACIYSGTCPERGTPPPEACGLTCEVDASELY